MEVQTLRTIESPARDFVVDGIDDDWEIRRQELDMKMNELSRGMSSSLITQVNDPIFR
jgi:hypothetical protein